MRTLAPLDYAIIVAFLALSLGAGMLFTRSAGRSTKDFFLSGRSLPWWLAGVSMAATNFSIDTPLAITRYVAQQGIGGVWFFWSSGIAALLAAFLFSRLWSRAGVVTDAELIELRYAGRPAAFLRLFKGFYFGVFLNCYVLGWVLKAVVKVLSGVTDLPLGLTLTACVVVALIYTLASGLEGVVWTDLLQYGVGMLGSLVLAVLALHAVGGVEGLRAGLDAQWGSSAEILRLLPRLGAPPGGETAGPWMPTSVFLVYAGVQWWAHKYADGGGKHIQRMLACRSEGDAQGATFFFAVINYAVQVWPWILTALCAMVILGHLPDAEMGYPLLMAKLLPAGLLGLLVVTLLSAFMSTVDTHLNLGASYIVNDIYQRFIVKDAYPAHYVMVSRVVMLLTLGLALLVAWSIDSIGDAWKFVLSFASGAGLTWILRWFWWRVNAWSELSAMVTSGLATIVTTLAWPDMPHTERLLWVVGVSTVVWLAVTYATAPVPEATLAAFLRKVRPGSPGWSRQYSALGLAPDHFLARGLVDWGLGVVCLFSLNFGIGALIFGPRPLGALLVGFAAAAGVLLWRRVRAAT
ncbi:MAG: sodium:solute symporter family protein [Pseudomonadota bacterium]